MIDIYEVLKQNKKETIEILKSIPNNTIEFAKWDEEKKYWAFALDECGDDMDEDDFCAEECPWCRFEGYDEMVVAIKLNDDKDDILVLSVNDEYCPINEEDEGKWYSIWQYDDCSTSSIYNSVGFWSNNKGF